ncbi:MAG: PH domain-containing protein [Prevotella sp.]|nr:PH domain-containing protein [Prevotella sp.]
MGYIEQSLMDGERIIYRAKLHAIIYWLPALLILSALAVFIIPGEGFTLAAQFAIALVLFLAAAWTAIKAYGGRQYVLTDRRLIAKTGIIQRDSHDLILRKCESVRVRQGLLGRILNYGTVIVSTGEATNQYPYIEDPVRFTTRINQQITADMQS